MRIDYNILWFEDDKTSYETKRDCVKDILEEMCFNLPEPRHETDGSNIDAIDLSKYDLIIADMNLNNTKASVLLDKIRANKVYTEVLFYSSAGEDSVRKELANYHIGGAYCSGRESYEFEEKAREVIKTLIKKSEDLTNLRGLVMSEVSELDVMMKKIICDYCNVFPNKENDLKNYIVSKIEERIKESLVEGTEENTENCSKNCKHIWTLPETKLTEIVYKQSFDSYSTARTVNKIFKDTKKGSSNFFKNYDGEIIKKRNALAHCESKIVDEQEVLCTKDETYKSFSEEDFKTIRRDIQKYEKLFSDIQFR